MQYMSTCPQNTQVQPEGLCMGRKKQKNHTQVEVSINSQHTEKKKKKKVLNEPKSTRHISLHDRGVILVPFGLAFHLRDAPLPWVWSPATFAPLLCLRGGAIAAFANLTVGRTGGLHCGDRGSLTLQVTLIGSGVIEQESSGVWAPGRGRQQSATLNLIVNIAVVPHCLCLQTLQHGALTIRATRLH